MGDFNPDLFVPVTSVTQMWGGAIIKSILTTFRLTWESTILLWRKSYCLLGPESISKGWTAFTETGPIYEELEREEDVEMEVLSSSDAFCLKNQCWPSALLKWIRWIWIFVKSGVCLPGLPPGLVGVPVVSRCWRSYSAPCEWLERRWKWGAKNRHISIAWLHDHSQLKM